MSCVLLLAGLSPVWSQVSLLEEYHCSDVKREYVYTGIGWPGGILWMEFPVHSC